MAVAVDTIERLYEECILDASHGSALAGLHCRMRVEAYDDPEDGTTAKGGVHLADGTCVGVLWRCFHEDGHVRHVAFNVDDEYQGRGIAGALATAFEVAYRLIGIDRITLGAEWHGSAYWPSRGYEAVDVEAAHEACWMRRRHAIDPQTGQWQDLEPGDWQEGAWTGQAVLADLVAAERVRDRVAHEAYEAMTARPFDAARVLAIGTDEPWEAENGKRLWAGRMLLAGAEYELRKRL